MKKSGSGFTIVELLIVIVVIAILAAISIVAYNGVQQRAANAKTTDALNAWVKAIKLYKSDKGQYPSGWTCLGEGYLYGPTGSDTSGGAQCRQDAAGSGVVRSTAFENMMKPYMNNSLPTPSLITARSSDTLWQRGIMYAYGGGGSAAEVYILVAFSGELAVCPAAGGLSGSRSIWGGNTRCSYPVGLTTDP